MLSGLAAGFWPVYSWISLQDFARSTWRTSSYSRMGLDVWMMKWRFCRYNCAKWRCHVGAGFNVADKRTEFDRLSYLNIRKYFFNKLFRYFYRLMMWATIFHSWPIESPFKSENFLSGDAIWNSKPDRNTSGTPLSGQRMVPTTFSRIQSSKSLTSAYINVD